MRRTSTSTRIALKRAPTSRQTRLAWFIWSATVAVLQCDMTPTLTNRFGHVNSFFQVPAKLTHFRDVRPPGRLDVRTASRAINQDQMTTTKARRTRRKEEDLRQSRGRRLGLRQH